jgi:periplasmic protein TonB
LILSSPIRVFLALLIAVFLHLMIFAFLPSLLIKKSEEDRPQVKSVTITMGYAVLESVKPPPPIKKKVLPKKKKKALPQAVNKPRKAMKPQKKTKKKSPSSAIKVSKQKMKVPAVTTSPEEIPLIETPDERHDPKPKHPTPEPAPEPMPEIETALESDKPLNDIQPAQEVKTHKQLTTANKHLKKSIEILKITDPEFKSNPLPKYPERAEKRGYEGLVELKVLISVDGQVAQIKIHKSAGYAILDRQAVRTVKKWKFIPRKNNDQAIETWVMIPIRFKLN